MTHNLIIKAFLKNPTKDFMITPRNLRENGAIFETHPMEACLDCPLYRSPFKRNLFRLYATILQTTMVMQIGIPDNQLSKIRFMGSGGHEYLLKHVIRDKNEEVRSALVDIHSILTDRSGMLAPQCDYSDPSRMVAAII